MMMVLRLERRLGNFLDVRLLRRDRVCRRRDRRFLQFRGDSELWRRRLIRRYLVLDHVLVGVDDDHDNL